MLFGGRSDRDSKLGKPVMRVPAKRVIEVIQKIVELYKQEQNSEPLDLWIDHVVNGNGHATIKNLEDIKIHLAPIVQLPPSEESPTSYQDYGNDVKFIAKTARGECAA